MSQSIAEMFISLIFKMNGDSEKTAISKAKQLKSTLTKLLGTIGISISLVGINNLLETWNSVNKVVNNLNTNLEDQYELQNKILDAANNSRLAYSDMANYVNNLVKSGSSYFTTAEDAADFLELANQLFQVSGATSSEISSLNSVLTTTFTNGTLSASGFSTILSSCPEMVEYLADTLGMTTQQVKSWGYAGKISARQLYTALNSAADEISDTYSDLSLTISDAVTIIKNKWGTWLSQLDQTYQVTDRIANIMINAFNKVLTVLEKISGGFDKLSQVLGSDEAAIKLVATALIALFAVLNTNKLKNIYGNLQSFVGLFGRLKNGVTSFFAALKSGSSVAQAFTSVFTNWKVLAVAAAIAAVVLVIRDLIKLLNGEDSVIGNIFEKLGIDVDSFKASLQSVIDVFKNLFNAILPTLQNLIDTIFPAIQNILQSLSGVFSVVGQAIITRLQLIFDLVSKIITALTPAIEKLFSLLKPIANLIAALADVFAGLVDIVADLLVPLTEVVSALLGLLTDVLEPIIDVVGLVAEILAERLSGAFEFVAACINGVISGTLKPLVEFLKYVVTFIKAVFTGDWNTAWKSLGNIVIAIINSVIASFEAMLNFCITAINSITSALSNLWTWLGIPAIPEISEVTFTRMAYLAEGGYVEANHPTPVVIGDNTQEGEIVSPISKMRNTVLEALRIYANNNNTGNSAESNNGIAEVVSIGNSIVNTLIQIKSAVPTALSDIGGTTYNTESEENNLTTTNDYSIVSNYVGYREDGNAVSAAKVLIQILAVLQTVANNFAAISLGANDGGSVTLTANEVRSIVSDAVNYLASSMNFSGSQTAAQTLENQVSNTVINQNVYMYNTFEGSKDVQKTTSAAMKTSATDITEALADAINYTR